MRNLKIAIFVSICLIVVISIILIILLNTNKDIENDYSLQELGEIEDISDHSQKNHEIQTSEYFIVEKCVNKYMDLLNIKDISYLVRDENGQFDFQFDNDEIKKKIYSVLDKDFTTENNINKDNVLNYIKTVEEKYIFTPTEIGIVGKEESLNAVMYKIKGVIQTSDYNKIRVADGYYIVTLYKNNKLFSIRPINENTYNTNLSNTKIAILPEKTEYNIFTNVKVDAQSNIQEYFNNCKNLMLANSDEIYNKMSKEYRNKRFGSIDEFRKFMNENKDKIKKLTLSKYLVNRKSDYDEYICKDQYENVYIFQVKEAHNYTVFLDSYTIDLLDFIEKYDKADNQVKAGMNIEKIIYALNSADYKYMYNKLDDTFKSNNYKTQQELEEYLIKNLYSFNKLEYLDYNVQGNIHTYKIRLTDYEKKDLNEKNLTINMKLLNNRDFVFSFSID